MLRNVLHSIVTVTGVVLVVWVAGCQTARQVTGTQFTHFSAEPDRVVDAAKSAMEELDLQMITSTSSKLDGQIEAKTAQGKSVSVTVNREAEGVSKVSIKVGVLGDETISHAILEKTRARLGESAGGG